ncbi:hypothetical protein RRG08_048961 [Elysia crispata]|uniref:Uncharacterized protein n=1 Tax=Elysia crispata TaxID=231223 RepID=A0AAE1CWE3_9GAST|nr:hypothetical protein RRG08_048961 [Elysia crispata]
MEKQRNRSINSKNGNLSRHTNYQIKTSGNAAVGSQVSGTNRPSGKTWAASSTPCPGHVLGNIKPDTEIDTQATGVKGTNWTGLDCVPSNGTWYAVR